MNSGTKINLWTAATVIGLLFAAYLVDRSSETGPAIVNSSSADINRSGQLQSMGPVELIVAQYTHTVTIPCSDAFTADGSFAAGNIPGVSPSASITSMHPTFGSPWVDTGTTGLSAGTVSVTAFNSFGVCGSFNEKVATVSGNLSDGSTYFVQVNSESHHKTITVPCADLFTADGSFVASDLPGVPSGSTITSISVTYASPWVDAGTALTTGTVRVIAFNSFGVCGSFNNEVATVTGTLSIGGTYLVEVMAPT